jgi:hypothetical protein
MVRRYGPGADMSAVKITEADYNAFVIWTQDSDKSRQMDIQFWHQFIGNSRKRLAEVVDFIFPVRGYLWETDPTPAIEPLFPIADFKKVLEELPSGQELDTDENEALDRLRRLISGEFKNGIPPKW